MCYSSRRGGENQSNMFFMTESGIILWNLHHYQRKMEGLKVEFRELLIFTCFYKCASLETLNWGRTLFFQFDCFLPHLKKFTVWEWFTDWGQAHIEIYTDICEGSHKYIESAQRNPFWGPMSHAGHRAASAGLLGRVESCQILNAHCTLNGWVSGFHSQQRFYIFFLVTAFL